MYPSAPRNPLNLFFIVFNVLYLQVDSYSAFFDNGGFGQTELHSVLQQYMINRVYITGLATDYCVHYTANDALTLGKHMLFFNKLI